MIFCIIWRAAWQRPSLELEALMHDASLHAIASKSVLGSDGHSVLPSATTLWCDGELADAAQDNVHGDLRCEAHPTAKKHRPTRLLFRNLPAERVRIGGSIPGFCSGEPLRLGA